MRDEHHVRQRFCWNRRELLCRQQRQVGSMIRIEPSAFDACRVCQIWHSLRVLVAFDEGGKLLSVFEKQGRARWGGTHMEARHRTKELDAGDPLRRGKDGSERIDKAYGDVVAMDIIPLDRAFAVGA